MKIKSMIWNIRNQKPANEKKQEKRIQTNEGSISSLWDNFKKSNSGIIGMPEGEEKEQDIGNRFEKFM